MTFTLLFWRQGDIKMIIISCHVRGTCKLLMDKCKRNPLSIREFMEENKKGHSKVKDITKGIY